MRPDGAADSGLGADDGVRVVEADDVGPTLGALGTETVDCVVCEHDPEGRLDGLAVLAALDEHGVEVPVLYCTDEPDGTVASRATRLGATEYVARSDLAAHGETLLDRVRAVSAPERERLERSSSFEAIAESVADGIVTIDGDSRIVYANEGLAELTGYDRAELIGGSLTRVIPERFHEAHRAAVAEYLETGERTLDWSSIELPLEAADGTEVPVEVSFGEFVRGGERYFTGVIRDVRERKERERELEAAERRFEAVFQHPKSFVAILDPDGRVQQANEPALEFVGAEAEAVEGEYFWESPWWTDDRTETSIREKVERAAAGESVDFEAEHYGVEDQRIVVDGLLQPVLDGEEVVGIIAAGRDITERQRVTETLRDRRRTLRDLYRIAADPDRSFAEKAERLLAVGCDRLDLPFGFVTEIDGGTQTVVASHGDHPKLQPGGTVPLEESYCRRTIDAEEPVAIENAPDGMADDPAYERFELGCYLGGKLEVDGDLHGTVCFAGDAARERAFDDDEATFVELISQWLGYELAQDEYERELREARDRVEHILERIDDGFFALDEDWRFTFVNDHAARIIDSLTEADDPTLIDRNFWEAVPEIAGTVFEDRYREAMERQEPVSFESRFDPLDAWYSVSVYPSEGGISVYFRDVTERHERERRLNELLETTRDLMRAGDRGEVARIVADAAEDVLGFDLTLVRLYDGDADALVPTASSTDLADRMGDRPDYAPGEGPPGRTFETGETLVYDDVGDLDDRDHGPVRAAMYLPLGEYGVVSIGATEVGAFDETDRQLAALLAENATVAIERADREQRLTEYETVLENVQGMVFVLDAKERFRMVTEPVAERLGYEREDLVGEHCSLVIDDDDLARGRKRVFSLIDGESESAVFEAEYVTADGDRFPAEIELSLLPYEEEFRGTVGVVRDISDLRQTKQQLAVQSDRFESLFQNVPDPAAEVRYVDGEPIVRAINPAFEEVFGYGAEEIIGESLNDYIVPADERDRARRMDERAATGETVTREVRRETVDGLRTFLFRGIMFDLPEEGRVGFGIYTDITEQKSRQRRLEVLHRILRHNIRTEMTLVRGHAETLGDRLDDPPAELEPIREGAAAVSELGDRVREIERAVDGTEDYDTAPTDVTDLVDPVVATAREEYPDADIESDLPDSLTAIADDRLRRALAELLDNAVEHAGDDPHVRVSARPLSAEWVAIEVADDGPGIPDRERELVTGKREVTQLDHASGLGLWTVVWIANALGGDVEFTVEDGTTVTLRLPRA